MKTNTNILQELFTAQAHLGHKTNRIHPKSKKYIYKVENAVSIIDLSKTAELLEKAIDFVSDLGKNNKTLLIVGTKKIAQPIALELSKKYGVAYIVAKWPPGLLTNFESIKANILKMKSLKDAKEKGEWESLVKFEQSQLSKELGKLERVYGGISEMMILPDALFIIDLKKEKNALIEAKKNELPVAAIADTNSDPTAIQYPIPANDDSASSIQYIMEKVLEAYSREKSKAKDSQPKKVTAEDKTGE